MKRILYDTQTEKLLPYPRADDGEIAGLEPHLVVVTETTLPDDEHDPATQRLNFQRTIDLAARTVTVQRVAIDLTPTELADLRKMHFPDAEAVDVRDWLLDQGITALMVEAQIVQLYPDPTEQAKALNRWQHATNIPRDHPLAVSIGAAFGFTPEQLDEQWSSILSR